MDQSSSTSAATPFDGPTADNKQSENEQKRNSEESRVKPKKKRKRTQSRWPRPLRSLIYRFVLVFAHRFSVAVHRSRELVFFLNLFSIARLCRYSLLGFTEFPVSSADRPLPFPEHSFVRKCLCNLRLLRYSYNLKNPRQRTGWFCDSLMGKRNFTEFLPSFT